MIKKQAVGILIMSFFLVAVSAYAKQKLQPPRQSSADEIVAKMKVQLELTDKQVDEVRPIIENYLAKEKQSALEEKKQLSRILTGGQMFTWNFLQNEKPRDKKKRSAF